MSLNIQNVSFRYGPRLALDTVSLQVAPGQIVGLLGGNGAGKSTLLRIVCGLLTPASGTVLVAGLGLPAARRQLGYVAQAFGLYPDLTVAENLDFYGRAYGLDRPTAATRRDAALVRFRLENRRRDRTGTLSHGWRQRVAMACALLHQPPVLLLDEATAGLDPSARLHAWQIMEEEAARGAAVFASTHHLDEAARCHSVIFLDAGRLAAAGRYADLAPSLHQHFESAA